MAPSGAAGRGDFFREIAAYARTRHSALPAPCVQPASHDSGVVRHFTLKRSSANLVRHQKCRRNCARARNASGPHSSTRRCRSSCTTTGSKSLRSAKAGSKKPAIRERNCADSRTGASRAYGERSGEVLEYIRRIISTEPKAQPTELIIHTKDGRERLWNFVASALGTQSDGRRLFVSMAHDATEQKAHEEQISLLMREVSHRAKNMLSLVQAIARQTAAREPEDFIGRFTERIQALAANQDLLVRNKWQGADTADLD